MSQLIKTVTDEEGAWAKSSHSGGGNDCVETAFTATGVKIRDTKHRKGGHITLPAAAWQGLLAVAPTMKPAA